MSQEFGKVAVLMGGWSSEREVSLMSGKGILEALRSQGVDAHAFDPQEQNLFELKAQGFERCFNTLHGSFGEDGCVQGALEVLRIPYTGPGVMTSAIGMDKVMTKKIWISEGLSTPRFELLQASQVTPEVLQAVLIKLGLPMVVKPAEDGSSIGVVKVYDAQQLEAAIKEAGEHNERVLCEQLIAGPELTCAVIGQGDNATALPLIQIVAPEGSYDYENKYFSDETQYICPAEMGEEEAKEIQEMALKAYRAIDCRGWGRVDFMVDGKTRKPYLLEINTLPGMTSHSLVPMAARATGVSYPELCMMMLKSATTDAWIRK